MAKIIPEFGIREQQCSRDPGSPPLRVFAWSGCTKSPQHYYRREEFELKEAKAEYAKLQ